jgi:arylsulfatase A-like enzyme
MNVIVLMADTWRFDYLGCYGNEWIQTPNIDKFARESVVFENAYAEGCPTIPTRRALFSGRYTLPFRGWGPLAPEDLTIPDILWSESIRTALITDTAPMHMPKYGYERGFDFVQHFRGQEFDMFYQKDPCALDIEDYHVPVFKPGSGGKKEELPASIFARHELEGFLPQRQFWKSDQDQMAARVCKAAMNYLEQVDKNKPFFLWMDSFDPHEPWDPPSVWNPDIKCPYDPDYKGREIILPVPTFVEGYLSEAEMHHIRMLYAEKITMVDKWLGKVLDKIKAQGLFENSLIIFLSDHGQPLGNGKHGHGIIRKCRPWPYEELTHIPLIVHHPDGHRGRVSSFVETVDVAPTIMDFLNVDNQTDQMQGKSLLPLVRGETDKVRDFAICGYFNFSWSIVTDEWSYVHWLDAKKVSDPMKLMTLFGKGQIEEKTDIWTCTPGSIAETPVEDELYDRQKDPFQLVNLRDQKADIGKALYQQLREYMMSLRIS